MPIDEPCLEPPILLFDDDDWLDIFDRADSMLEHIEYPAIDEVRFVADSVGQVARLGVGNEDVIIERVMPPDAVATKELRDRVATFFRSWTQNEPPAPIEDTRLYVAEVVASYSAAEIRRKKAK